MMTMMVAGSAPNRPSNGEDWIPLLLLLLLLLLQHHRRLVEGREEEEGRGVMHLLRRRARRGKMGKDGKDRLGGQGGGRWGWRLPELGRQGLCRG